MSKAIKLEDNNYLDSSSVSHNRKKLKEILDNIYYPNIITDGTPVKAGYKIDNKEVYIFRKNIGALPNNTVKRVAISTSVLNLSAVNVVELRGIARGGNNQIIPLPFVNTGNVAYGVVLDLRFNTNEILLEAGYNRSNFSGYVDIYFTY